MTIFNDNAIKISRQLSFWSLSVAESFEFHVTFKSLFVSMAPIESSELQIDVILNSKSSANGVTLNWSTKIKCHCILFRHVRKYSWLASVLILVPAVYAVPESDFEFLIVFQFHYATAIKRALCFNVLRSN